MSEWQDACAEPLRRLQEIVEKRKRAVLDLIKMGGEYQSLNDSPEVRQTGMAYGDDPTHYLQDAEAWLNVVNKLCTQAGVVAITAKVKEAVVTIAALRAMDDCFTSGTAEVIDNDGNPVRVTQEQAWNYLNSNVVYYIQQELDKDLAMELAGY